MDQGIWENNEWVDTNEENMIPCDRVEGRVYTIEREDISLI